MVKYLVGRAADPILGIATGVFAYYLYESDPKNAAARPEGRKLQDLVGRWWAGSSASAAQFQTQQTPAVRDGEGRRV